MKRKPVCFYKMFCGCVLIAGFTMPGVCALSEMKEIKKIVTEQVPSKDLLSIELPTVSYSAEGFKDPFQGVVFEDTKAAIEEVKPAEQIHLPELKIQGIIWGTSTPQAIINNKVVKVGGTINDITIQEITGSEIIILYKNKRFAIPSPSANKTPDLKLKGGNDGK